MGNPHQPGIHVSSLNPAGAIPVGKGVLADSKDKAMSARGRWRKVIDGSGQEIINASHCGITEKSPRNHQGIDSCDD